MPEVGPGEGTDPHHHHDYLRARYKIGKLFDQQRYEVIEAADGAQGLRCANSMSALKSSFSIFAFRIGAGSLPEDLRQLAVRSEPWKLAGFC